MVPVFGGDGRVLGTGSEHRWHRWPIDQLVSPAQLTLGLGAELGQQAHKKQALDPRRLVGGARAVG